MRWLWVVATAMVTLGFAMVTLAYLPTEAPIRLRHLDVTKAYACGYLDGISHAPITPPEHLDWCDDYTRTAHENGFNP